MRVYSTEKYLILSHVRAMYTFGPVTLCTTRMVLGAVLHVARVDTPVVMR